MNPLTSEHYTEALANGVSRATLYKRVVKMGWDVERAITTKVKKSLSDRNTKQTIFSREQLRGADEKGISRATLYSRIKKGLSVEEALSKPIRQKTDHDWENEIYAMYHLDDLIADGTVYEIAEATNKNIRYVKRYVTDYYKETVGERGIVMELLYKENEDVLTW